MSTAWHVALLGAGALACVGAVAWVVWPVLRGTFPLAPPDPRAVALLARREAILANLRDLDADRADGRLSEAEHARLRAEVVMQGTAVLAALDRIAATAASRTDALVAAIEADVGAAARGAPEPGAEPEAPAPAVAMPPNASATAAAVQPDAAAAAAMCPACGKRAREGDRFCAACGQPLGSVLA